MGKEHYYNSEADESMQLYFKEDPELCSGPQFHDSIEFVVVTRGSVIAHLEGKSQVLEPGDIFFAESYETHFYEKESDNINAIVCVISRDYLKHFRELYPGYTFPTFMTDKEKNKNAIQFLIDWLRKKEIGNLFNFGCVSVFLSILVDSYPLIKRHDYTGDILTKELLRYIHLHYLEAINLSDLAHHFGYTVEYCSKTLKKALKCNFREYINMLRLRKANELMLDKSLNLTQSEILYACGFSSPATYFRVKKQMELETKEN